MSKPPTSYFCENGHLVEHNSYGEFGSLDFEFVSEDSRITCPFCKSEKISMLCYWMDEEEYCEGEITVPHKPIKTEDVEAHDKYGNKYYKEIPVYDVNKIFRKN